MTEKAQDKKQKTPGKGTEEYRGQKPAEKGSHSDSAQKKGQDTKKKW